MDLQDVSLFRLIVSVGSLSAAARELNITPMGVSRRLAKLEEEMGVRLFHRTTRALSLTPDGEAFLPYADDLVATQDAALSCIGGKGLGGTLKLTAPNVVGREIVAPVLWKLMAENPALQGDLTLTDANLDVAAGGLDMAIRVGSTLPPEMVATRIADSPRLLCASPGYAAQRGLPKTLGDLTEHACLNLHGVPYWPFVVGDEQKDVRVSGPFKANSVDVLRSACVNGVGITFMTYWNVSTLLAQGDLVRVELEDATPVGLGMWAIFATRRQVPARVRALIDALRARLAEVDQECKAAGSNVCSSAVNGFG